MELTKEQEEIEALKLQLKAANEAKEASARQVLEAGEVVQDLKKQLAEKPAADEEKTYGKVTVGKATYDLVVPSFNYLGEIVTIDVLNQKSKLAEQLVKDGVSFLQKAE
ncbi:hypothetical protein [Spirosoma rhododendri]|uniref:Uncharacterized protein n=1 Tax=Spirosoma rhododendri TaxID=2728024 RepID=A0A7L5DVF5_9BACT|nr:hypothetical protein [Spirosoma rhododendri]QJD79530.1 hypothetical protein HH216_14760 [Spirosoma rhododendri]